MGSGRDWNPKPLPFLPHGARKSRKIEPATYLCCGRKQSSKTASQGQVPAGRVQTRAPTKPQPANDPEVHYNAESHARDANRCSRLRRGAAARAPTPQLRQGSGGLILVYDPCLAAAPRRGAGAPTNERAVAQPAVAKQWPSGAPEWQRSWTGARCCPGPGVCRATPVHQAPARTRRESPPPPRTLAAAAPIPNVGRPGGARRGAAQRAAGGPLPLRTLDRAGWPQMQVEHQALSRTQYKGRRYPPARQQHSCRAARVGCWSRGGEPRRGAAPAGWRSPGAGLRSHAFPGPALRHHKDARQPQELGCLARAPPMCSAWAWFAVARAARRPSSHRAAGAAPGLVRKPTYQSQHTRPRNSAGRGRREHWPSWCKCSMALAERRCPRAGVQPQRRCGVAAQPLGKPTKTKSVQRRASSHCKRHRVNRPGPLPNTDKPYVNRRAIPAHRPVGCHGKAGRGAAASELSGACLGSYQVVTDDPSPSLVNASEGEQPGQAAAPMGSAHAPRATPRAELPRAWGHSRS